MDKKRCDTRVQKTDRKDVRERFVEVRISGDVELGAGRNVLIGH